MTSSCQIGAENQAFGPLRINREQLVQAWADVLA